MMSLRTMRLITDTRDASGHYPVADQLAALWDGDDAQLLRASANFIFQFKIAGRPYILRFNHESERTRAHLQAEIDYLASLATQGLPIARPIASRSGAFIESLSTPDGAFYAVVFEALSGDHPEFADLTPDQFKQWGQTLGQLHKAAESYTRSGRPTWQDHIAKIEADLPAHETEAHTALARVNDQLNALPVTPQNFGLIHFDFELDNLLWQNGEISIIDFDDSAFYWFAADIAFALRDLFDDDPAKVDLTHETLLSFVEGYRGERTLSDEDLQQIPVFLRLHNLLLFTKLIRSLGPDVPSDDPAWTTSLRARFKSIMDDYRASFSD